MRVNRLYRGRTAFRFLAAALALPLSFAIFGATASAAVGQLDASQDLVAPTLNAHTSLPTATAFFERALSLRVDTLATLSRKVALAKSVPAADRATLVAELSTATSGMAALQVKAPTEPTLAAARADLASMVLDYHVLSFVDPQVLDVLAADADLDKAGQLQRQETAIQAAIAAAGEAHQNVAREKVLLKTFQASLNSLTAAVSGLPASLLALEPASVPGSIPTITAATAAESRATVEAAAAATAEQRIVTLLATPAGHVAAISKALRRV